MATYIGDATNEAKEYVANGGRLYYYILFQLNDGNFTQLPLGQDDIIQDSVELQWDSSDGDFSIGGAIASQVKFTINNRSHEFDSYLKYMENASVFVALQEGERWERTIGEYKYEKIDTSSSFANWLLCGYFQTSVEFSNYNTIDIVGYDTLHLYQHVDLIDFIDKLPYTRKFTFGKTRPSDIITVLKDWLMDETFWPDSKLRINNIKSDIDFTVKNNVSSFNTTYHLLLPKEFYGDQSKIPEYSPKAYLLDEETIIDTSEYDTYWDSSLSLWENKSLLDFIRYFAQIYGMYVCVDYNPDKGGCRLHFKTYKEKNTTPTVIKNIKNITYDYKEYSSELNYINIKTETTTIPFTTLTDGRSAETNFFNTGYKYNFSGDGIYLPASTEGYEFYNHSNSYKNYLTLENNPFVTIPIWDHDRSTSRTPNAYTASSDGGWGYGKYWTAWCFGENTYDWVNAVDLLQQLPSNGNFDNLKIRNFSCTCLPQVGIMTGDYLRFYYDPVDETKYFDSLITHITFKPNISLELSLSYDKSNPTSVTGMDMSTDTKRLSIYRRFYTNAQIDQRDMVKNILRDGNPTYFYFKKSTSAESKDVNFTTAEKNMLLYMIVSYLGETVVGQKWKIVSTNNYAYVKTES